MLFCGWFADELGAGGASFILGVVLVGAANWGSELDALGPSVDCLEGVGFVSGSGGVVVEVGGNLASMFVPG